jgi:phosphoglucomutase
MASLIANRDAYQIATGNDAVRPAWRRHARRRAAQPNHYLAVAIDYLYTHRPEWPGSTVGRAAVCSSIIDRWWADWAAS